MQSDARVADRTWFETAQALLPELEAAAAGGEERDALPRGVVDILRAAGLTDVSRSSAVGGREVDLVDYLQAVRVLAQLDASIAWCLQIYNVTNWLINGLFDDSVLEEVYAPSGGGLVTGSMAPNGPCLAMPCGGAHVVSGQWRFVSGCDHADWMFLKAPLPGEELPRKFVLALAPRAECVLGTDWQYAGLQATGSKGVEVEALEVPAGYALRFDDRLLERGVPPERGRTLAFFRLPSRVIMRLPITAVALGVAQRALEIYESNIRETRPNGFSPMGLANFQQRYAESALDIDQAEGLLLGTARDASAHAARGEPFPSLLRARYGRDLVQAVHLCMQAVDRLMAVSGARQMFNASPMQAAFRDIHAIACHHSCDRDRAMSNYAKVRLGLDLGTEEV